MESGELDVNHPLTMLATVREYLNNHLPQLASRELMQMQQLALRVWQRHFKQDTSLRGRALSTYEALSQTCDAMAADVDDMQQRLKERKLQERRLQLQLDKAIVAKRQLEAYIEKRDELSRTNAGLQPSQRRTVDSVPRPQTQPVTTSTFGVAKLASFISAVSPGSSPPNTDRSGRRRGRPVSGAAAHRASADDVLLAAQQTAAGDMSPGDGGGVGSASAGGVLKARPRGSHWDLIGSLPYSAAAVPTASGGMLAHAQLRVSPSDKWTPLKREAMESNFLARMEIAASPMR